MNFYEISSLGNFIKAIESNVNWNEDSLNALEPNETISLLSDYLKTIVEKTPQKGRK